MASIDDLKTLLNFKISDGSKLLPCKVFPSQRATGNYISLFYNGDNDILALGKHTRVGSYIQGVQVAVRHTKYEKARTAALSALEYLSVVRDDIAGVFYNTQETEAPSFLGVDDTGANVWGFTIRMIGDA